MWQIYKYRSDNTWKLAYIVCKEILNTSNMIYIIPAYQTDQ